MDAKVINAGVSPSPDSDSRDTKPSLDPLRRVFVPIERKDVNGRYTFRTTDGQRYTRDASGAIRSHAPKLPRTKKARRRLREHLKQQRAREASHGSDD